MPNLEWEVPHTIISPYGSLDLNVTDPVTFLRYQIIPDGYRMGPTLRVTSDYLAQDHGSVPHPRWRTGITAQMTVRFLKMAGVGSTDYEVACEADLRTMYETLMLHLNAITELASWDAGGSSAAQQRLLWTPSGYGDRRMLDDILLLAWTEPADQGVERGVQFSVESPFPYAIDLTEVDVAISGSGTITNLGNSPYKPVVEVAASSAFTITNNSILDDSGNPLELVFNASLPGGVAVGGGGAEINFFRGTIFQGGAGADLIQGIDPTLSDFFPLIPGANNIVVSGTTATFKTNHAWV